MTVNDIIDASRTHQVLRGCAPTLIGLHPDDMKDVCGYFGWNMDVTHIGGVRVIRCDDVAEGEIDILLPVR